MEEELIGDADTLERLEHRLDLEELKFRLSELSPIYREALVLFYYQDLSIAEISELLKEKEGTIKSRLSRARSILAKEMKKGGSEDE